MNQGYATADFATGTLSDILGSPQFSEDLLGIPEDGTYNYRNMAIQFRYAITNKDIVIVQLSNTAAGESPIEDFRDEVELDWAFYERRLAPNTGVKVGRVQVPLGIYNEIRDVGTILPFFRPAFSIYLEGSFTSETVDGVAFYHTFNADSDWPISLDLYVGEYENFEISLFDTSVVAEAKAKDVFGGQLWLSTPIEGLRFGFAASTREISEGLEGVLRRPGEKQTIDDWLFSIDGSFEKWVARAELRRFEPTIPSPFGNDVELVNEAFYVQLGWLINEKFHLYAQHEVQGTEQSSVDQVRTYDFDAYSAYAVSLNYLISPNVVLKAEHHWTEIEAPLLAPVFGPTGPKLDGFVATADDGNYSIVSLAVAF